MTLIAFSSADDLDSGRYEAERAADLRRCSSRSKGKEQLERERQTRWSAGGCGKVAVLEDQRDPGSVAAARLRCDRKTCPDCGPRVYREIVRHFTAMIGETPVVRRELTAPAWRSASATLRRAGAQHLRIPAPGGKVVVYATGGPGTPVDDLGAQLAGDVAAAPPGGRITSSKAWARQPVAGRGTSRWKLLGMAKVPLAKVVQVAQDLGLYHAQVDERSLPPGWAEVHLLRRPDDQLAWRRFRRWIGLHWPERHRRGVARAA